VFAICDRAPGRHVALGLLRNGKPLALDVVVTAVPAQ
jgi:hypothetical protein